MTRHYLVGDSTYPDSNTPAVEHGRLVAVIDPEDDASLSVLWRLLPDHLVSIDQLQAALREFANPTPPKPAEPTGLGAVVEDDFGTFWTKARTQEHGFNWRSQWGGNWKPFGGIAVVRVLSEGVTA